MNPMNKWAAVLLAVLITSTPADTTPTMQSETPKLHNPRHPNYAIQDTQTLQTAAPLAGKLPRASRANRRTPTYARHLTTHLAKQAGHNAHQRTCLTTLWTRESNFRPNARNHHTVRGLHAGGIPQILGMDPSTPVRQQITRGLAYIEHRYGTPCQALRHHTRRGWY